MRLLGLAVGVWLVLQVALTDYAPVQDYTAVVVAPNTTLPSYQICPNATGNVFFRSYNLNFGVTLTSIGCCPVGFKGVPASVDGTIVGCCPPGQVGCTGSLGELVGCADNAGQCCGPYICSRGYGCCPIAYPSPDNIISPNQQCCYLGNTTNADDFGGYCESNNNQTDITDNLGLPIYLGCKVSNVLSSYICTEFTSYFVNGTFSNSTVGLSQITCNTASECVNVTIIDIGFDNFTTVAIDPIGCCATGLTPCINDDTFLVGCANTTAGETCCGGEICPGSVQCCTSVSGNQYGCCAVGTTCCLIGDPNTNTTAPIPFCGASYNNALCVIDAYSSMSLFVPDNTP